MAIVIYIVRFLWPVLCCSCLPGNLHLYHDIIYCAVDIEKWQILTLGSNNCIIWQSLSHIPPTFVSALLSILFSFLNFFSLSNLQISPENKFRFRYSQQIHVDDNEFSCIVWSPFRGVFRICQSWAILCNKVHIS